MKKERIIRAWKEPEFRDHLSPEERAELPDSPSGQPVGESELEDAVGGATRRTMPLRVCMDVCWSTDVCNA